MEEGGRGGWRRSRVLRSVAGASAHYLRPTWKRTMPEKTTTAFLAIASSLSMTTLVRWMTMKELVLTRKPAGKRGHGKYSRSKHKLVLTRTPAGARGERREARGEGRGARARGERRGARGEGRGARGEGREGRGER